MTNYLAKYAYFTKQIDLDKAASEHKQEHWRAMNNTDRDVLDVIRRVIRKLAKLGIIDRVHYVR